MESADVFRMKEEEEEEEKRRPIAKGYGSQLYYIALRRNGKVVDFEGEEGREEGKKGEQTHPSQ